MCDVCTRCTKDSCSRPKKIGKIPAVKIKIPKIKLYNDVEMPLIGFGLFCNGQDRFMMMHGLQVAIRAGYRLFDSAWVNYNEDVLGQVIRDEMRRSHLHHSDFFVTSKVWNTHHMPKLVRKSFEDTMKKMNLAYLDLLMIHYPMAFETGTIENDIASFCMEYQHKLCVYSDVHYLETYREIENLVKENKVKNIGVCNFNKLQLKNILENCEIKPSVLYIEVHPYLQNDELIDFCHQNDIKVMCYGPIGVDEISSYNPNVPSILENHILLNIGRKYGKTAAQVSIRWCIQRGLIVVVKSITAEKILEFAQVFDFELTVDEMNEIKTLNQNRRIFDVTCFKSHKFYPFNDDNESEREDGNSN